MKKRLLASAGAFLLLYSCSTGGGRNVRTSELDSILRSAVTQKQVPGAVAMVAADGDVVYEGAFGMSKDAICAVASMTKPVTSVAVMQLVESGRVKLDEPAATYVPELARVEVLEKGRLRPAKSPVTVRQLLTHTAGFSYEFMNHELAEQVKLGKVPSLWAGGDAFLSAPLVADPGTRWEYGINTDWLGRLVEKVSGRSLEEQFRAEIFEPLGMSDSYFLVPPEKRPRVARVHQRREDGTLEPRPAPSFEPDGFFSGGGGLYSTASDYLRFAQAILGGGVLGQHRILKPESVALMGQNQIGELPLRPFTSLVPQLAKDGSVAMGRPDKFGLGFALNTQAFAGGRGANTMSWSGIYNTFFWIDREKKICAVLMMQMLPGLDDRATKLLVDFESAVYKQIR